MPLDNVDRDLLEDLLGRTSLPEILDEMAAIYEQEIPDSDWGKIARGIAADVADTVRTVVADARMSIARRVRDGAELARKVGL